MCIRDSKHLEYLHGFSKRMAKLVGARDVDFGFFSRSRKFLKQLLTEIEAQKQKPLEVIELIELRDRIVGWPGNNSIVQPGRQFMHTYEFTSCDDKQPFSFILCSDLLLVAHKKGKKTDKLIYDFSAAPQEITLSSLPDSINRRHSFSLSLPTITGVKLYTAASQQEKEAFFAQVLLAAGVTCIFGKPLSELDKEDGIPVVFKVMEKFLSEHIKMQGIFRENGNANQITALREAFDRSNFHLDPETSPHTIAGLLKLWLRMLPEPICPPSLFESLISLVSPTLGVASLLPLLKKLPVERYDFLRALLKLLHECSSFEATNKMSPHNLAIVFGPTILSKTRESTELLVMPDSRIFELVAFLIQNQQHLFS